MIIDGGPAFPRPASEFTEQGTLPDGNVAIKASIGMSLRDYTAIKAMNGIISCPTEPSITNAALTIGIEPKDYDGKIHWLKVVATQSYAFADAMLEARIKEPK